MWGICAICRRRGNSATCWWWASTATSRCANSRGAPRPYRPEAERAELVAGLECVDYVVIFPQTTAVELVKRVQPTYYAKGGDYTERDLPESEAVVEQGGFVVILPLEAEQSTTQLVEKIKSVEC
jgi:rfaE bifunctional protein nucleotidyltransferase chain/domain